MIVFRENKLIQVISTFDEIKKKKETKKIFPIIFKQILSNLLNKIFTEIIVNTAKPFQIGSFSERNKDKFKLKKAKLNFNFKIKNYSQN